MINTKEVPETMRILYLECSMGAAGDMLAGALSELTDRDEFLTKMNSLGLENTEITAETAEKCGIQGTQIKVLINGEEEGSGHTHSHSHPSDIREILSGLNISDNVRKDAEAVYRLLAEAEAHVHGKEVEEIHFHEVGNKDAIADITAVCILMDMIKPDKVAVSPVATGSGQVHCAHGILPVPAPATAYLLQGIPSYAGSETEELCTPAGAALLKYFGDSFETMPVMRTEKIGYGMGKKDFASANCVRAFLGETAENNSVVELVCNLDDMTPEEIGFAQEILMEEGALDVYTTSVYMKKNRPGWVFTCMCRAKDKERMLELMFRHTTTLGIRENVSRRHALRRSISEVETSYGNVRIKKSSGFHTETEKLEYEDLAAIARKTGLSIRELRRRITLETDNNKE